jgi:hypothetical protein
MGALPNHYSGTASGINNAVTRISNVLANAVVGALAVLFFAIFLTGEVNQLPLKENVKTQVIQQAANLGDAEVPTNVPSENNKEVERLYREGFIKTYSLVMRISAILAFVGALMTFLFIQDDKDSDFQTGNQQ